MCVIQRECSERLLTFVRTHPVFDFMRDGIAKGDILPCVRKKEIHFYEGGARLFRFSSQTVYTDRQYIDEVGGAERPLSDHDQSRSILKRIRDNARRHRTNPSSELAAVHSLFPDFSFARSHHRSGQLAVIDVEARFASDNVNSVSGRMIDLVFLMPDLRLLFVEVKCMGNEDIESSGNADVEKQVADCEHHIGDPCVLDAINRSLEALEQVLLDPIRESASPTRA